MLSYLLYEDGKIIIDEITPKGRFGNFMHTSWKALFMYHALEGYINGIDHKWELLENTSLRSKIN